MITVQGALQSRHRMDRGVGCNACVLWGLAGECPHYRIAPMGFLLILCCVSTQIFHWETATTLRNSSGDGRLVNFYEQWPWNMALLELFLCIHKPSAVATQRNLVEVDLSLCQSGSHILLRVLWRYFDDCL